MHKRLKTEVSVALGLLPLVTLLGCGGSSSHTVATGTTGSLRGIDFIPVDHTLKVDTDTKCRVYWHTGYTPPAQFVVSLKTVSPESKKESVRTELKKVGNGYVWQLEPVSNLDPETVYFIEVEAAAESEVSMFLTEPGTGRDRGRAGETEPTDRGALEHEVVPAQGSGTD